MSRSGWKLPYFHASFFRLNFSKKVRLIITASRSSQICNRFRKKRFGIHNGRQFRLLKILPEMFLCKLGEFSTTRRIASGISMHIQKTNKESK